MSLWIDPPERQTRIADVHHDTWATRHPDLPCLLLSLCLLLSPSLQVPVLCQQRLPLPLVQVPESLHSWPHHLLLPGGPDQHFRGKQGSPWHVTFPVNLSGPPCTDWQSNGLAVSLPWPILVFFLELLRVRKPHYYKTEKSGRKYPRGREIGCIF